MDRETFPSPLSFDTSLIKYFCKTPETDKTNSSTKRPVKKQDKKLEKIDRPRPSNSRFLFQTDPSFEDISIDLIKNMRNEDSRVSKEKFDGSLLIMNMNDREIYNDLNEPEEKRTFNAFSTSFSTSFTTPRLNESYMQKTQSIMNSQSQTFKNLSFISNDSNVSSNCQPNQNDTNNLSRRNTNESIFNQDYTSFFSEWRNMRYFQEKQSPMPQRKSTYGEYQEYEKRSSGFEQKTFDIDLNRVQEDGRTTIMIKNIPNKYDKNMLMKEINLKFRDKYDFFYLPIDFTNRCNVGYAFINFVSPNIIREFFLEFNRRKWEKFNSEKICVLTYGRIQGKKNLTQHFENSTVMKQPVNF
jgi:hypothetical protein